jgi:flagellar hook-basal body complex protein FliE
MTLGDVLNGNVSTANINKLFDTNTTPIPKGDDFSKTLQDAIEQVNTTQLSSYDAMSNIATGEVKNLQEAVIKIEKGELNLRLALEVKNKTLSAYKEIMRMQL